MPPRPRPLLPAPAWPAAFIPRVPRRPPAGRPAVPPARPVKLLMMLFSHTVDSP